MAIAKKKAEAQKPDAVIQQSAATQYGLLKDYVRRLREYGLPKLAAELANDPANLPGPAADLGQATARSSPPESKEHQDKHTPKHSKQTLEMLEQSDVTS